MKYLVILKDLTLISIAWILLVIGTLISASVALFLYGGYMFIKWIKNTITKLLNIKHIGWIFVTIAIIGTICNAMALIIGFFIWLVSNSGLALLNWKNKKYDQMTLFIIYDLIAIAGIIIWIRKGI
jgi:hypothetical protein